MGNSIEKVVVGTAVFLGNTVGQVVPWKCAVCGDWHSISRYSGNIFQGGIRCPTTGQLVTGWPQWSFINQESSN